MSTFQTNAGNIILTSSKLHIRAIHHTLSEIRPNRRFSYQGIAIKRNYKGQKSLVEVHRKHGFDLKKLISISNYSSSFYGDIEGVTYFPSSHDRSISMVGALLPISPLTMTQAPLCNSISHPSTEGMFTSSGVSCRRENKSFGTVLL